jgi:hypothetical protein
MINAVCTETAAVRLLTLSVLLWSFLVLILAAKACAGPPYITDDPEPVGYQHWEIYLASLFFEQREAWSGTGPHLEVNYGAIPNVQLHLIAPLVFYVPSEGSSSYGYGDTELGLGVKLRFIQEGKWRPQFGTFPLFEVPSSSHSRNLGSGHPQAFLPIWLQKTVDGWTAYGGGGYWINPRPGNRNWWYTGIVIERQIAANLTPGFEFFHGTSQEVEQSREIGLNFGMIWDASRLHHVIFSAGPAIQGPNRLQGYFAYQLTFGP